MKTISLMLNIVLIVLASNSAYAQEWPQLALEQEFIATTYVSHAISVEHDLVYDSSKRYRAYALSDIIKKLIKHYPDDANNAVLIFTAKDGYQVTMRYTDALTEQGYVAYSDLSAKGGHWIGFNTGSESTTPAPYYLVWPRSGLDKWRYPWPYQLTQISMQPVTVYYAKATPDSSDEAVLAGFSAFIHYCIRCHAINGSGGKLAPNLIKPQNITERFDQDTLNRMILQAPSYFTGTKMPVYSGTLSSRQVDSIVRYLKAIR